MSMNRWKTRQCLALLLPAFIVMFCANTSAVSAIDPQDQPPTSADFMDPAELKTKIAKKAPVTIVDVRATSGLRNADNKIKGAIYVKLRRLKYRVGFPPLRDVPRDQEIVTYCACQNDESAIRAAQILAAAGFKHVRVLKGGWTAWQKSNGQMESLAGGM